MKTGEKLALARRYHQPALRQKELAEMLGVDTSTIGRWECTNRISRYQIRQVAEILDVTEKWLLTEDDTPPTMGRPARPEPVKEEPNIKAVAPQEMTRSQQLISEMLYLALPVWRGVVAGDDAECAFIQAEEPEFREIPMFLTMGQPERHVLCIASGMSMAPRIEHTEKAIVRFDPDVPPGHIVVARSENRNFIKKLALGPNRNLELHSLNENFPPITNLRGWSVKGGVVAIIHNYKDARPNIEWNEGRFLKA